MAKEKKTMLKLLIKPDFKTFFNPNRLESYRNLINFFILIGGRGIGKTTGYKFMCLSRYVKKQEEFVYIRRYQDETKACKTLFDEICSGVTTQGIGVKGCFQFMNNKQRMGYCVALTNQSKLKSGVDFSKVTTIVFDEAIIKRTATRRYLDDEIYELLELISTIVRLRKNYAVYILGNNLDIFNPYFEYFNVPNFDTQYINKEIGLYCEKCKDNSSFVNLEENTPLYKLTKNTSYGDYHYNNKVLITTYGKIGEKDKNAKVLLRLIYNTYTLNIYQLKDLNIFIELRDKVINDEIAFTIFDKGNPNYYDTKRFKSLDISKYITKCFYKDMVIYENDKSVQLFSELMEVLQC